MKKALGLALVIAFLSFVGSAFGAVAVNDIDGYVGEATNIDITGQKVTFDGSKVTVLANGHKEGVTANVSTESHLTSAALAYGMIRKATVGSGGSTGEIATLANGTPGQMVTIELTTYDGVCPFVISDDGVSSTLQASLLSTGWDDITFNSSGDSITLLYMDDTNGWIIVGNNGCSISQ